jgi:hypothetical protein
VIKVLINGTPIYKLCFARKEYSKLKNGQPLYETSAMIFLVDAKQGEPPVATATARQYHKDMYQPESARKAALGLLLDDRARMRHNLGATTFSKMERTAIWSAYRNRPRIISTPPGTPMPPKTGAPAKQLAVPPPTTNVVGPKDAGRPGLQAKPASHQVVNKVVAIPRPWYDKGNEAQVH